MRPHLHVLLVCMGLSSAALAQGSCQAWTFSPASLPTGTTGTAYPDTAIDVSGGNGKVTLGIFGLPIAMTFDGGTLGGTPTQAGEFDLTVNGEDDAGCASQHHYLLTVDAAGGYQPTSLALAATTAPSATGEAVHLLATVDAGSGDPSGTVSFLENDNPIGSVPVSAGTAAFTVDGLAPNSYRFGAIYSGDAVFGGSSADATAFVAVVPTTTTLSSDGPSVVGQAVTLVARVSADGGSPDGFLQIQDGMQVLGTGPSDAGELRLTTSGLAAGTHTLVAHYLGDGHFAPSDSPSFVQVVAGDSAALTPDGGVTPVPHTGCSSASATGLGGAFFLLALLVPLRRRHS